MRYGLNLLNFGPDVSPRSIDEWARLAEDAGFSTLTISDHVAITSDVFAEYQTPFYDPLVTLAYVAAATERVRLGTSVLVVPYRHPLLIARSAANIDQLSGGRLFLGIGVGWAQEEFDALDLRFAARGRCTDEYLDLMRRCWTEETVEHEGEFSSFPAVHTGPPPAQPDGIPIWVGGESPKALRRAVERGDVWHPLRPAAGWLEQVGLPALRRAAEEAGRQPPPVVPRILLDVAPASSRSGRTSRTWPASASRRCCSTPTTRRSPAPPTGRSRTCGSSSASSRRSPIRGRRARALPSKQAHMLSMQLYAPRYRESERR
jgi:probable F420-dependent oxidoreductase